MTMGVYLIISVGAEKHRVLIRDQQRNSQRHTFPCSRQTKKSNLKILESGRGTMQNAGGCGLVLEPGILESGRGSMRNREGGVLLLLRGFWSLGGKGTLDFWSPGGEICPLPEFLKTKL